MKELQDKYNEVVNEYALCFIRKHELCDEEDANKDITLEWVGSDIGGVLEIADYYINFSDIKIDIDKNVDKDEFWKYYQYCEEISLLNTYCKTKGITIPNYTSWIKGCPRLSQEQIDRLFECQRKVQLAKDIFEKEMEK